MKTTDKFLIGIVAGISLLVVVTFVVALTRPPSTYQPDDTPAGAAHNYLLAVQKEDYARAYEYLSPTLYGYPSSVEEFALDVRNHGWNFRLAQGSTALEVASANVSGNLATVKVKETRFYTSGLFQSREYTNTFAIQLRREDGAWKVVRADAFWAWCWENEEGCQ